MIPIDFHFSWPQALCALILPAFAAWLVRRSCARSKKRMTRWLEGLRFAIILFISLLLFQPEWKIISIPEQEPEIRILYDHSGSMETVDALNPEGKAISRKQLTNDLIKAGLGKNFEQDNIVHITPFGGKRTTGPDDASPVEPETTDMAFPLDDALVNSDNIRAIIMIGDGQHNASPSPLGPAQKMRSRSIPLYMVPIGSEKALPDLALLNVQPPVYGIVGEMVQIPYTVRNTMDIDISTELILKSAEDGSEKRVAVKIPARGERSDSIVWKIPQEGNLKLELSLPVHPGEYLDSNNAAEFSIAGRKEAINVLMIETLPRWEYRFIRNALYRDPGVKVNTLLIHPHIDEPGGGPGYIPRFPDNLEDLSRYDVIFVGDIGIGGKGLTTGQAALIKGLVANQASGIVFLPGSQGNQIRLLESDLADLIPVTLDRSKPEGMTESEVMSLALTSEGRGSLLTLLADNEDDNDLVWKGLPGFNWYAPVLRAKTGTQVLAVHSTRKNAYGRIPLIVTQPYGNGKVLYMGIDSAWRWRKDVEDRYHYRFWGQVARWMSYRRNMAAGQNIRLMITPERPRPGDTVNVTAIVSDNNGAPLVNGEAFLDITDPKGSSMRHQLRPTDTSWGSYATSFKATLPGPWSLKASSPALDHHVESGLTVAAEELERQGMPVNTELMREMASVTRGRVVPPEEIDRLVTEIRRLPVPPPQEKRIMIWSHPVTVILLLLMMTAFWTGRKLNGDI